MDTTAVIKRQKRHLGVVHNEVVALLSIKLKEILKGLQILRGASLCLSLSSQPGASQLKQSQSFSSKISRGGSS